MYPCLVCSVTRSRIQENAGLERETGFEPMTPCLEDRRESPQRLLVWPPLFHRVGDGARASIFRGGGRHAEPRGGTLTGVGCRMTIQIPGFTEALLFYLSSFSESDAIPRQLLRGI